jgi:hypothetical protein
VSCDGRSCDTGRNNLTAFELALCIDRCDCDNGVEGLKANRPLTPQLKEESLQQIGIRTHLLEGQGTATTQWKFYYRNVSRKKVHLLSVALRAHNLRVHTH